jgi:PST family polysaccharide transporter
VLFTIFDRHPSPYLMMLRLGDKKTLMGRTVRALGWSFLSIALVRLGTFGIGVVLARLLGPHAFGTYAVALVAQLAILSFNELGVSLAIVRWPGDPRDIASTVATIACASSLILYIAFMFGAPAFATALGGPAASPVIRVLATGILIDGFVAVPAAMLQRSFRQDRKMLADQVHSWLGAGVSIGLALLGFGPMSLAIGSVVGSIAGGTVIIRFSPPPRFGFDAAKARALLGFGLPLAGSSFIVFLVGNVDNVIVGHVLGATALGFYVLAWNLSSWPVTMFSMPVRAVAPALFSRLQHDKAAMRAGFLSAVGMLTSVTFPVCLLIAGSAVPLVRFVYGLKWVPAAQALSWLALLAALRILFELSYDFFVVLARSRVVFTVQLAWLVALIPALVVGVREDGIRGAAIAGFAVAACVVLPWYLIELHRVAIKSRALGAQVWVPILAAVGVGLFARDLGGVMESSLAILLLSGAVALGTIALLLLHKQPELTVMQSTLADSSKPVPPESATGRHRETGSHSSDARYTTAGSSPDPVDDLTVSQSYSEALRVHHAADSTIPLFLYEDTLPLPIYNDVSGLPRAHHRLHEVTGGNATSTRNSPARTDERTAADRAKAPESQQFSDFAENDRTLLHRHQGQGHHE